MNIIDRILLSIYSLLIGVFALLLIFVPFSNFTYNWISYLFENYSLNWQNIFVPIFFLAMSIRFLLSGIKFNKTNLRSVVRHTSYGEVNISLQTIEGMAQKAARSIPGLRDIKAVAHLVDDGILIYISALTLSDISIPEVSVKIQQNVKEYIEAYTGILVKEVKIKIYNIVNQSKSRVE